MTHHEIRAAFATIANNTSEDHTKSFALQQFEALSTKPQFRIVQDQPNEGWSLMLGPIEVVYLSSYHMTQNAGTEFMMRLADKLNGVLDIMKA